MTHEYWAHRAGKWKFTVNEYRCCGNVWQLLMSRRFPGNLFPVCPNCDSKGSPK